MKRQLAILTIALCLGAAAAIAAPTRDGGVIRNSGSTNAAGYTIKVWSDGRTWSVRSSGAGTQTPAPAMGQIAPELAQAFLRDALQARDNHATTVRCMKSASFGTTTTVLYHGWTSPDLECPGGQYAQALAADAHKIAAALNLSGSFGRRIPMLPNEPRRVPAESTPQASATPEPATSPS